jgi:biotin carboxyl carrier protein
MKLIARIDSETLPVEIDKNGKTYRLMIGTKEYLIDATRPTPHCFSVIVNNRVYEIGATLEQDRWVIQIGHERFVIDLEDGQRRAYRKSAKAEETGRRVIKAQMPGKVVRVLVAPGDEVQQNQGLLVIEAMKMQNEIKAPKPGRVTEVGVALGTTVNAGDLLLVIE